MHSQPITVRLMDIITGTATNGDGEVLFEILDIALSQGKIVRISLDGATPFSSSFMNASFGAALEKYGEDSFKKFVIFNKYTTSQLRRLKAYLEQVSSS